MSDTLQPKHRSSSYQRLKAKLKRNPSSYTAVDKKDWPRPQNVTDLLIHAIKGGGRAFLLAYGIRAGVIFCLSLLRVIRKRAAFGNIITASLKNETALRFAGMFGSFAFLWKLVNNGMRIYRDKDDRLNGLVAGAVAGLAILCEKQEKRVDIAQQLFVRALQGVYNAGKARDILYFKHGDALLFGLACGQILYAYTMQPHTLDPGYYNFMVKTARVPGDLLILNEKNVRGFPVSQQEALAAVNKFRPTKNALAITKAMPEYPAAIPCEMIHPWVDGCHNTAVERFLKVCQAMFPVYGTLHFVPMLLLRTKHLRKDPKGMLAKTSLATLKSCAFLGLFVMLYQYQVCMHRKLMDAGVISSNSKYFYGIFGFVCSFSSIFLEEKKRRGELAMYCLPIALKSAYQIAYQRKWIIHIKHFEVMMTSVAMAIIMSFYQEEPDVLSSFVRKIMYQFFGKN
ncbi:hypothetical protein O0I10_003926 [Lichtheimia ornata]|uniref:Transmembrane protein 135 N-terminal domain-containing protein n=1 Tax=Lichtheimia ornata TaxID=688661 RepID=A0AAD7V6X8_9FUNG|nr:uncharacterized protein O0I10_003926 [Lichtheimia ornata]KAJ8660468.1 hypothetical protein O0I10_003926 [Lichtheimia ornata]